MKYLARIRPLQRVQALALLFFAWLLARNAWYGDDVFISMRVIDNFVSGYGLVWNVGERVQVFSPTPIGPWPARCCWWRGRLLEFLRFNRGDYEGLLAGYR